MQEPEAFRAILESWGRLSSAETEAIESGNWAHLAVLHVAKEALKQRLGDGDGYGNGNPGGEPTRSDPEWVSRVAELREQERANLALLWKRQSAAEDERAAVERARWNLRRQMGSFGQRSVTSWQQYS